jgi:hypothetical protein
MIGRQFSYYCLPEDLDLIQDTALSGFDYRLYSRGRADAAEPLTPISRLRLDYPDMGKVTLFLIMTPPPPLDTLRWTTQSGMRFLDTAESYVVEVGRCFTDGKILRDNRFWYAPISMDRSGWVPKDKAFTDWADSLYRRVKKVLYYEKDLKNWFGPAALASYRENRYRFLR